MLVTAAFSAVGFWICYCHRLDNISIMPVWKLDTHSCCCFIFRWLFVRSLGIYRWSNERSNEHIGLSIQQPNNIIYSKAICILVNILFCFLFLLDSFAIFPFLFPSLSPHFPPPPSHLLRGAVPFHTPSVCMWGCALSHYLSICVLLFRFVTKAKHGSINTSTFRNGDS